VLYETLRVYPPAGSIVPRVALVRHKIGDYVIEKGDEVATHFGDRNCLHGLRSVTYCSPKPQNPK
jgi:cytochrome P450